VTGTFAITDPGAPNASPGNMWIGLAPDNGVDPQYQFFTYEFWVRTAAGGSFKIPHVLPGTYALYAFGPGAAGSFKNPTDVTVTAGQTLNLGTVSWTPPRTAATVWEIGVRRRATVNSRCDECQLVVDSPAPQLATPRMVRRLLEHVP
jgi:rhamnogalacturonan endolyase